MVNAVGLVLGLLARERTGKAQYVESTMIAANAYANIDDFYWHAGKQPRPLPDGDGHGLHARYRLYRARTGWVFLACPFEDEWQAYVPQPSSGPTCWMIHGSLLPKARARSTTTRWPTSWAESSPAKIQRTGSNCSPPST